MRIRLLLTALVFSVVSHAQVMDVAMSQNNFTICKDLEISIQATRTAPTNNSLDFDGTESMVLPYSSVMDRGTNSFTIEFWVLSETTGTTEYLAVNRNATNVGWAVLKDANGRIGFVGSDLAGNTDFLFGGFTSTSINDANWHHIAVVYDRGTTVVTIYVDGVYDNDKSFGLTGSLNSSADIVLGAAVSPITGNMVYMQGAIDEFRMWSEARSSGDIQTFMSTHLNPVSFPTLDINFDFNELTSFDGFEDCAGGILAPALATSPSLALGYSPNMTFNFAYNWVNTSGNTQSGANYTKAFKADDTVIVETGYCKYYSADTAFIEVLDCDTAVDVRNVAAIYAPTAFTPNGDTRNDYYVVKANAITYFELEIYNRHGSIMFHSLDINTGWDGTYLDRACHEGTYTARIIYRNLDGEEFEKYQAFSLMR